MPTSRTTCITEGSTGAIWLTGPSSPSVAATLVSASRIGMPAATSAPNANTRMSSVSGSVRSVDLPISSLLLSTIALVRLSSPISSTRSSGWAFCAAATAANEPTTDCSAVSESPGRSKVTSAECPSAETWPAGAVGTDDVVHALRALEAFGHVSNRVLEPCVADAQLRALNKNLLRSLVGERAFDRPGCLSGFAGQPDCPSISFAGTRLMPTVSETITKASHPKMAFLRC